MALDQVTRFVEAPLSDTQIRKLGERPSGQAAVAALEGAQSSQQLFLGLGPAPGRDQDAGVVGAADRGDEVAPGAEASRDRHPFPGAGDVEHDLARAQHPAVDVTDRNHANNLTGRDGCHCLVQELHSLSDATVGNVRLPEQRERVEFEVDVPVASRDRQCRSSEMTPLRGVIGEGSSVEHQPPVAGAFLGVLEQRCRTLHPATGDRHVAVDRTMQEREPACPIGSVDRPPILPVRGEGTLRHLDRSRILPQKVERPPQPVERLSSLLQRPGALEVGESNVPVPLRKRPPALAGEISAAFHATIITCQRRGGACDWT